MYTVLGWLSVVMVVAGTVGTGYFFNKAGDEVSQSLRLETERLRTENLKLTAQVSPRRLTPDEARSAVKSLGDIVAGKQIAVITYVLDGEALGLAQQFVEVLKSAGARPIDGSSSLLPTTAIDFGVRVYGEASLTGAVRSAFPRSLFEDTTTTQLSGRSSGSQIFVGSSSGGDGQFSTPAIASSSVRILIGVKPIRPSDL